MDLPSKAGRKCTHVIPINHGEDELWIVAIMLAQELTTLSIDYLQLCQDAATTPVFCFAPTRTTVVCNIRPIWMS